jgi:hypothetical protein
MRCVAHACAAHGAHAHALRRARLRSTRVLARAAACALQCMLRMQGRGTEVAERDVARGAEG